MRHHFAPVVLATLLLTLSSDVYLGTVFAQGNSAPVILEPVSDIQATEGDTLRIPIVATDADLDQLSYTVTGGQGAVTTHPKYATKSYDWFLDENTAETYNLTFSVSDGSVTTEKTITLTVADNTSSAFLRVIDDRTGRLVVPGEKLFLDENQPKGEKFRLNLLAYNPNTGAGITPTVSGDLGRASVSATRLDFSTKLTKDTHDDVGIYDLVLTAADSGVSDTTFPITAEVQIVWHHQDEAIKVFPNILTGGMEVYELGYRIPSATVNGTIAIQPMGRILYGNGLLPNPSVPSDMRTRVVLHTGPGQKQILRDNLLGTESFNWDSTSVPDGPYALTIEFVEGSMDFSVAAPRFQPWPILLFVGNVAGPITGAQMLPSIGFTRTRDRGHEPTGVDWVSWDGTMPVDVASTEPYPHQAIAPPTTAAARAALSSEDQLWFTETWLAVHRARMDIEPFFAKSPDGNMYITGVRQYGWDAWRSFHTDGPRNVGNFTKLGPAILRPDLDGPGFLGINHANRLFHTSYNGVNTIAGRVTRIDVVPYGPMETRYRNNATREDIHRDQQELIGNFQNNLEFESPADFVIDPQNTGHIYVADTGNDRIALVDRSGSTPVISTFAGVPGTAGYQDGPKASALFDHIASVEIIGRTLYVADENNHALRSINLDTGDVTTVVGRGANVPTTLKNIFGRDFAVGEYPTKSEVKSNRPAVTWQSIAFEDSPLFAPYFIRRTSENDLIVQEGQEPDWTQNLRLIDFDQQNVKHVAEGHGRPFAVDHDGRVGNFNDIIQGGAQNGGHDLMRVPFDTGIALKMGDDAGFPHYAAAGVITHRHFASQLTDMLGAGSYAKSIAIDDEASLIATVTQHVPGMIVYHPVQPSDPISINRTISDRGANIYVAGTVPELFVRSDIRSSVSAIHGRSGHNGIGTLMFDDMAKMSDRNLIAFIRGGFGSTQARSEITGRDLRDLIYFIRVASLQGKTTSIDPASIALAIKNEGLGDSADLVQAEIGNVLVEKISDTQQRVSWTTDEPTIGVVQHGKHNIYGLSSEIEPAFSQYHQVIVHAPQTDHYRIVSKDYAGNITYTPDALLNGQDAEADTTPPTLSNIQVSNITDTSATITWDTDELANATVNYGLTTSYGQTVSSSAFKRVQSINLTGLGPGTTYHFQASSTDPSGNTGTSADQTFQTNQSGGATVNICIETQIAHRKRKSKGHQMSQAEVTITDEATSTVVYSGTLPMEHALGQVRIDNPPSEIKDDSTTKYTITVDPVGSFELTRTGLTDLFASCIQQGETCSEGNKDGEKVELGELVSAVSHFRGGGNAVYNDTHRNGMQLGDLVALVSTYIDQGCEKKSGGGSPPPPGGGGGSATVPDAVAQKQRCYQTTPLRTQPQILFGTNRVQIHQEQWSHVIVDTVALTDNANDPKVPVLFGTAASKLYAIRIDDSSDGPAGEILWSTSSDTQGHPAIWFNEDRGEKELLVTGKNRFVAIDIEGSNAGTELWEVPISSTTHGPSRKTNSIGKVAVVIDPDNPYAYIAPKEMQTFESYIHKIDLINKQEVWKKRHINEPSIQNATVADGKFFGGSYPDPEGSPLDPGVNNRSATPGYLFAMDGDGNIVWSHTLGNGERSIGKPVYKDDIVYFPVDKRIIAFNASSGQIVWEKESNVSFQRSQHGNGLAIKDKYLIVSGVKQTTVAMDATNGNVLWTFYPEEDVPESGVGEAQNSIIVSADCDGTDVGNDVVYVTTNGRVVTSTDPDGRTSPVYGLDLSTGNLLWRMEVPGSEMYDGASKNAANTYLPSVPFPYDERLFTLSFTKKFYGFGE